MHLVDFIIRICHDAWSHERKTLYTLFLDLLVYLRVNPLGHEINLKLFKNSFPAEKRRNCLHVIKATN
jgi:hypothetical protein